MVKKVKGVRWSKTNSCWYITLSKQNFTGLMVCIGDFGKVDYSLLQHYLEKRNKIVYIKEAAAEKRILTPPQLKTYNITDANLAQLLRFVEAMQLSGKSESTIKPTKMN